MKKVFLSILIAAGACTFLNSCSNGDYNADPSGTSGQANPIYNPGGSSTGGGTTGGGSVAVGTFTATVNGSAFSGSLNYATDQQGILLIDGSTGTTPSTVKLVALEISSYNGVGTYPIGPSLTGLVNGITYDDATAGGVPVGVDTGQIVITVDNSTSYQGTFYGSNSTGLSITNGKFNVKK